ncbi:MAG: TIGR02996 domain-containing protein, partial [Proteobacteria bacterium]|nr:TIGR02996 domain-containing protein [Pseudomonadota bacterium]
MILDDAEIDTDAFAALVTDAVARADRALLARARAALPREVGGHKVGQALVKLAYEAPREPLDFRMLLHELSIEARGAPREAFNNAIHCLGWIHGTSLWDPARARRWLALAVPHGPANPHIFHNAACAFVLLGDRDRAIQMVAGAVLYDYEQLPKLLVDDDLASLRDDPRYATATTPGASRAAIRDVYAAIDRTPVARHQNPDLEAAIAAEPGAIAPYLVYGDWLQERGDPRGPLIAIQAARRAAPDDASLRQAEAAHLAANAWALLGELAVDTRAHDGEHDAKQLTWHLGFIRAAFLRYVAYQVADR